MVTYLLAWNPKGARRSSVSAMAEALKRGEEVTSRWGCGQTRRPAKGDRFFLIRLGVPPKGIIGSGTIIKGSYEVPHWDSAKAHAGRTSRCVQVHFEALLDPETEVVFPREALDAPPFSSMHWSTQMSGIRIPDAVAKALDKAWRAFLGRS